MLQLQISKRETAGWLFSRPKFHESNGGFWVLLGNDRKRYTFAQGADPRHATATNGAAIRRTARTSVSLIMSSGCAIHFRMIQLFSIARIGPNRIDSDAKTFTVDPRVDGRAGFCSPCAITGNRGKSCGLN